jgi:chromosome partitioning protein
MLIHRHASSGLGIDVESVEIGTYQILEHSHTPKEAIVNVLHQM